jgi:hypothetical protein
MQSVRRGIALGLPLAALAVGAAAAIALGNDDDSGIKGWVVPCGIVLERPAPCSAPSKLVGGKVLVGQRDHVVRRAKIRANGSFRVRLDPGHYWLQARTSNTRGPRTHATVSKRKWTTVTLVAGRLAPPRRR